MQNANKVITANTVMLLLILIAGVIIVIYGHIYKNTFITGVGFFVAIISGLALIVFQVMFRQKSKRGIFYYREFGNTKRKGKLK